MELFFLGCGKAIISCLQNETYLPVLPPTSHWFGSYRRIRSSTTSYFGYSLQAGSVTTALTKICFTSILPECANGALFGFLSGILALNREDAPKNGVNNSADRHMVSIRRLNSNRDKIWTPATLVDERYSFHRGCYGFEETSHFSRVENGIQPRGNSIRM